MGSIETMANRQEAVSKKQSRIVPGTDTLQSSAVAPQKIQEPVMADLHQQIRDRAYEIYESRGRDDGHDLEDWVQAEAEILARNTKLAA
jgi:hypothetical protein